MPDFIDDVTSDERWKKATPQQRDSMRKELLGTITGDPRFTSAPLDARAKMLTDARRRLAEPSQSIDWRSVPRRITESVANVERAREGAVASSFEQLTDWKKPKSVLDVIAFPGRKLMAAGDYLTLGIPTATKQAVKQAAETVLPESAAEFLGNLGEAGISTFGPMALSSRLPKGVAPLTDVPDVPSPPPERWVGTVRRAETAARQRTKDLLEAAKQTQGSTPAPTPSALPPEVKTLLRGEPKQSMPPSALPPEQRLPVPHPATVPGTSHPPRVPRIGTPDAPAHGDPRVHGPETVTPNVGIRPDLPVPQRRPLEIEGNRATLAASKEFETGRQLDLGEVGRRRAAERMRAESQSAPFRNPIEVIEREIAGERAETLRNSGVTEDGMQPRLTEKGTIAGDPTTSLDVPTKTANGAPLTLEQAFVARQTDSWKRWLQKATPRDWAIADKMPQSTVLTRQRQWATEMTGDMEHVTGDLSKGARMRSDLDWVNAEAEGHAAFTSGQDAAAAIRRGSPDIADIIAHREKMWPEENAASLALTGKPLPKTPGAYLPRATVDDYTKLIRRSKGGRGSLGEDLAFSLSGFGKAREHATWMDGVRSMIEKGQEWRYLSPRISWYMRELQGAKLRATGRFVNRLRQDGVLFDTKEAAVAAGHQRPYALQLVDNGREFWVRSLEEQTALWQMFKQRTGSMIPGLNRALNIGVRNLNLWNPLPHETRNMYVKYQLASKGQLSPAQLVRDMKELHAKGGLSAEYLERFPHTQSGRLGSELIADAINRVDPSRLQRVITKAEDIANWPNRKSQQLLFSSSVGDPGMRYSLYKWYRRNGHTAESAANHVNVDLINYGMRGDIIDLWKSIPGNFFVPWRFGSIVSLLKQTKDHPVQTAFIAAGVDLARDAVWRYTGLWFHTPIDYIEKPVAEAVQEASRRYHTGAGLASAVAGGGTKLAQWSTATLLFGPNGAYTAQQLVNGMRMLYDSPSTQRDDLWRLLGAFWSIGQLNDMTRDAQGIYTAFQKNDPKLGFDSMARIIGSLALGARTSVVAPAHAMGFGPSWPGQIPDIAEAQRASEAEWQQNWLRTQSRHLSQDAFNKAVGQLDPISEQRIRQARRLGLR